MNLVQQLADLKDGWLDLVALEYSAKLNNLTSLCITKLDVLDSFEKIKVCIGYELDGQEVSFKSRLLHKVKPIYEEIEGGTNHLIHITLTKICQLR